MGLLDVNRSLVLVIDMQGKLMEVIHGPQRVIRATCRLMRIADLFQVPVVMSEHYPRGLGTTHPEIRGAFDELTTVKRQVEKESFSCCGEGTFAAGVEELRPGLAPEERQFVVAGIETHICVVQTVAELLAQGSQVHVCWECISGRGQEYRQWALRRMEQEGAVVTNHESVGFEWARNKNHPQFRSMNSLFKQGQID